MFVVVVSGNRLCDGLDNVLGGSRSRYMADSIQGDELREVMNLLRLGKQRSGSDANLCPKVAKHLL